MDAFHILGTTLGLGLAAGMRLYATVLALGLALRYDWLTLPEPMQALEILAHPAVLITAGVAYIMEFVSDKIPWVDSAWDALHTVIRPLGAAALAFTAFGKLDPVVTAMLMLVCGSVALSSHTTKAATRLAVNTSPEPFSNWGLSLLGDLAAPAIVWMTVEHPLITFVIVCGLLVAFFWLIRKLLATLRNGWAALKRHFA